MYSSSLPMLDALTCAPLAVPTIERQDIKGYLDWIWLNYFSDCRHVNVLTIDYAYPWKRRLGLIRLSVDSTLTFIGINCLLLLPQIPECVLITTIAHELVHYIHGFGSPLPRCYPHPHAHQVVERELERRALGNHLHYCNQWIDNCWYSFYDMQRATGWAGIRDIHHSIPRR